MSEMLNNLKYWKKPDIAYYAAKVLIPRIQRLKAIAGEDELDERTKLKAAYLHHKSVLMFENVMFVFNNYSKFDDERSKRQNQAHKDSQASQ